MPSVISTPPPACLIVKYLAGNFTVKLGNELKPDSTKEAPCNVTWPAEASSLYTLVMVDPDAPSRKMPLVGEVLHWLVINIQDPSKLSDGKEIVPYLGPGPPEGSGLHRYIFLAFRQPARLVLDEKDEMRREVRYKFNTKEFVKRYNLSLPVAGNFFQAQTDDSVRMRWNQRAIATLQTSGIVGDVIDVAPPKAAMIKWPNEVISLFGLELTPTQVKDQPEVKWPSEPNALYTIIFSDPDAPSRKNPIHREFLHWLVVNIKDNDIGSGQTIAEYIGSGPPKDTSKHRYVFLVFKQSARLSLDQPRISNTNATGRANFNTREFAKKHNLGNPVASNFFEAQYDDYTPILHAQLSAKKN